VGWGPRSGAVGGGSVSSSQAVFLDAVQPEVVIVSVGCSAYGHPSDSVVQRRWDRGSQVYRTDRHGAVSLLVYQDGSEVQPTRLPVALPTCWRVGDDALGGARPGPSPRHGAPAPPRDHFDRHPKDVGVVGRGWKERDSWTMKTRVLSKSRSSPPDDQSTYLECCALPPCYPEVTVLRAVARKIATLTKPWMKTHGR
jgi:hypothetical protein